MSSENRQGVTIYFRWVQRRWARPSSGISSSDTVGLHAVDPVEPSAGSHKCEFVNFSSSPLFNISMTSELTDILATRNEGGRRARVVNKAMRVGAPKGGWTESDTFPDLLYSVSVGQQPETAPVPTADSTEDGQSGMLPHPCKLRHNLRYTSVHLSRPLGKVTHGGRVRLRSWP